MKAIANLICPRLAALAGGLVLAVAGAGTAGAANTAPGTGDAAAHQKWLLLGEYCEKCHNANDWAGSVAFDTMQPQDIPQDAKIWEEAVTKLQGRLMPPPGEKQPPQARIDSFVSWLQTNLDTADAAHPDPGYVSLHRLNRTEYARSVQELLGVTVDVESLLPKDTMSDGFDDIANVLKVSPTFLDQYISAASSVAALAMGNPQAHRSIAILRAPRESQAAHIEGLPLGTHGMLVRHDFPADGDYEFDLGRGGPGALLLIDGKQVYQQSAAVPGPGPGGPPGRDPRKRTPPPRLHVSAGPHDIAVAFVQHEQPESDDWLQPLDPAGGGGFGFGERATGLQITGPFDPTGVSDTPSRHRIFVCQPADESAELPSADHREPGAGGVPQAGGRGRYRSAAAVLPGGPAGRKL
jgi:hypothetical protein